MERKASITVVHSNHEYEEVISLLKVAIEHHSTYHDRYLKIIVRDAQLIKRHPERMQEISCEFKTYSIALSGSTNEQVAGMDPNSLSKDNLQTLLDIFGSL